MHLFKRSDKWLIPLFLALLAILFYWEILFTNHFMFPWDISTFFYPYLSFVHEELRHFRMPLWDPYAMSGFPIIGDPEAQIFYPLNWFFVVIHPFGELPYKLVECLEIFHFFLAGLFMYILARTFVQSMAAALCSGVLFIFSGAMVVHTQHLASIEAMSWYPLIFLLARRGLLEGHLFFTVSAGLIFGVQILAGHWQHSVYLGVLLLLYFAYEAIIGPARAKLWPRWILNLLTIGAVGAALAMVQMIPTHELGDLSVRSYLNYADITDGSDRRFLLTLFLPNFYGGLNGLPAWSGLTFNYVFLSVPGCLLALLGLMETIRHRNFFWLGMIFLCTEISYGNQGPIGRLIYHVPILNLFRNPNTFFDVANFALCLMAALGAEALFSRSLPPVVLKHLPLSLTLLLLTAVIAGLALSLGTRIHGWYHMLAVLALATVLITAMLRNNLPLGALQASILGLMLFQLFFYQMNQEFNAVPQDPRKRLSHDFALGQSKVIRFLHADAGGDFRVAAFAGPEWSDSGPNVWRIPGVYGWNPITLRRYDEYIREFTNVENYATPWGGPDTNLHSSMLDLLGAKYVLVGNQELAQSFGLPQSEKFERIFTRWNSLDGYRNKNYLSRIEFYPKAYVLPDEEQVFALMASQWFDGRRTLLMEAGDAGNTVPVESLSTVKLRPEQAAVSSGAATADPLCANPNRMLAGWAADRNGWLRYEIPPIAQPGQYILLMKYTAAKRPAPSIEIEVQRGDHLQHSGPITLPGTFQWRCDRSRTADLGTFELSPGSNHLKITSRIASDVHIYALWLIRLPADESKGAGTFSFTDYFDSTNRVSFHSKQDGNGFVLLNEINYPGWEGTVDGHPTEIFRGDGIFRVVFLPAGSHDLEFRFRPRYFALGAAISLITLGTYLTFAIFRLRVR
jgi:hypothetical protein